MCVILPAYLMGMIRTSALLCWLEDELHRTAKIRVFRQKASRAKQHRRVPVVPAGMHYPGRLRCVRFSGLLDEGERVHVSA